MTDRTSDRFLTSPRPEQTSSRESWESQERSTVRHQVDTRLNTMDSLDGKIVFPSDDGVPTSKGNIAKPPACHGSTFCENVRQYPKDLVDMAIQHNSSLKLLTSIDVADIEQRIHSPDEVSLCVSNEKVVFPQSAENTRNEWLFVVNQDNFKQGVRVELCSGEDQKCSVFDGLVDHYQTMCKQKYISRELVALGANGKVVTDTFRFPASCCCHIKYTGTSKSTR
ncbi:Protein spaetzle [Harpegnathos saltator]|uniref:Protein spaetzle n=2 Tax=Harpegnathos saltator TaxID=610380 RepID=E2C2U3_HARSA|nr:Protein spaetzle [Harpegnathos saltator]